MLKLIQSIKRQVLGPTGGSKNEAKQRLKILLIHDQVDLTQGQLDNMQKEILEVVHRYLEVDDGNITFKLSREDEGIALVGQFPVRRVTGARA